MDELASTFRHLCVTLAQANAPSYAYADLNDFLTALNGASFAGAVRDVPTVEMDEVRLNYLAAMIEQRAALLAVSPPDWTRDVEPLRMPVFASNLEALRLHLLVNGLPSFRRRNLFVDTSIGGRV